jgi:hypothetical protein
MAQFGLSILKQGKLVNTSNSNCLTKGLIINHNLVQF